MKMNKVVCSLCGIALTVVLTACGNDQQASAPAASAPADQAVAQAPAVPAKKSTAIKGKVVESMDASGYTYIRIDDGSGSEIWGAIPKAQLEIGEEVTLQGGSVMRNFSSKSLDKTFDSIIFASGVIRGGGEVMAAPADGAASFAAAVQGEGAAASASGGSAGNVVAFADMKIEKAAAANAHTVGDVFGQATALDTQKVTVKGQVVKVSKNIMGKNWLHIQDGTGDPSQKTHDLVVTTSGMAEKGAIVTIEGTIAANKDFGSGYKYDVIIEDATVVAQ